MRIWPHNGFSVDPSVLLPAGDWAGIEWLVQYTTRCPFSLSRLVRVTETRQVVYKADVHGPDGDADRQTTSSVEPRELTFVDEETF